MIYYNIYISKKYKKLNTKILFTSSKKLKISLNKKTKFE